jgi:hypothetical protein
MKIVYKSINALLTLVILLLGITGCKKFVTVDTPITQVSTENAFKSDANAAAVVTGIYAKMSNNYINTYNIGATCFYAELSADNLVINPDGRQDLSPWYQNALEPTYSTIGGIYWNTIYTQMYTINSSIEALTDNKDITPTVSKRLLGEAYFLRGFCYFYLANLYGDVPLVLSSVYKSNTRIARSSISDVYNQIVIDLNKAAGLLDNTYVTADRLTGSDKRIIPNLAAVDALLARIYLYQKNYAAAETAASKVITESALYAFTDLSGAFLANSKETIWAIQPVNLGYNTFEAQLYTLPDGGPDYERPAYLSASLMNTFEPGDDRKNKWVGTIEIKDGEGNVTNTYNYASKYKTTFIDGSKNFVEYPIVLRLAEQYLIRAEARSEQGNTTGAIDDLNALRTRSRAASTVDVPNPLPNLSASLSKDQLKPIILKERRVELFTEWGHRWFDLKRTNTIDAVMVPATATKGGTWAAYKALYPIPVSEILLNSLLTQNPGYTK